MSLEVVAVADDAWRICDGSIDEFDARRVLGYIEKRDGRFEALSLNPAPAFRGNFDRWDEALQTLVDAAGERPV